MRDSIAAYDPAVHQAPITIGHPRDNLPAYGWIGSLSFDETEKTVDAEPVQLEDAFVSMVKDGRFTKRSASWYLPDAASNPTPGKLYLRHVAFLGAQPPAIKGLKRAVEFTDDEAGTIEFSDSFETSTNCRFIPQHSRMVNRKARRRNRRSGNPELQRYIARTIGHA